MTPALRQRLRGAMGALHPLEGRRLPGLLALVAAAALVGKDAFNAGLAIVNARRLTSASGSVIHSQEVRVALQQFQRILLDANARQLGFVLTGEPRYLDRYRVLRGAVERHFQQVVELTGDEPAQQGHLRVLRPLLTTSLDLLDRGIRLRGGGAFDAALAAPMFDQSEHLMEAIETEVHGMVQEEDELLQRRERSSTSATAHAVVTSLLGLAASLAIVIGALWALDRRTREVARARRALMAVLRALPDAVLLVKDREVVATNSAAEQLFREAGRAAPRSAEDVLALAAPSERFERAVLDRQELAPAGLEEALRVARPGGVRRMLPRTVPLLLEDGSAGLVVVLSDVTDLARLDEMRTDLVAAASHELRTPMTTLRMSLLMLREGAVDLAPRARALVETALLGVQQLLDTVDEMLDLTRIEAGRMKLSTEPLHLCDLAREAVGRSTARAEELGIRLTVQVPEGERPVAGDRARLRIVLDNLVRNALKYTPPGGAVALAVGPTSRRTPDGAGLVELSVTDTGPGVPEEFRTRVFEKFFRVEHCRPGTENAPRGAGMGLFLCKQIVELHGGTIRCEAGPDRRGARFAVALPALEAAPRRPRLTIAG